MSETPRKRLSLFEEKSLNKENPGTDYGEMLNKELKRYLELLEKNKNDKINNAPTESTHLPTITRMSDKRQEFLMTLPSVDSYVLVAEEFLNKHEILVQQQQSIQKSINENLPNLP